MTRILFVTSTVQPERDMATSPVDARKGLLPALVLFFLSPAIGELLSGSAPPVEFFNPVLFVVLCAL